MNDWELGHDWRLGLFGFLAFASLFMGVSWTASLWGRRSTIKEWLALIAFWALVATAWAKTLYYFRLYAIT
jgi:hypothetical protein